MSWEIEKSTGDIVLSGFEQGIQQSPHKGTANLQNVNISTEMGEVMPSFDRVQETVNANTTTAGTLSTTSGVTPSITVSYLLVGGGAGSGGAGANVGGGGGGGGKVLPGTTSIGIGAYPIVIGGGGIAGVSSGTGGAGTATTALSQTAPGGLGGLGATANGTGGTGGASGGGNAGGSGTTSAGGSHNGPGGGGAGDGAVGGNAATTTPFAAGTGGAGTISTITGSSVTYSGGGAGGGATSGTGGAGGGGNTGSAGAVNTGGGGGGTNGTDGTAGGSGVAVISVPTGTIVAIGGTKTTVGGNDIYTFTSSGTFTILFISGFAGSVFSLNIPNSNNLLKGNWIVVSGSSNTTQLPNGNYFVVQNAANYQLSTFYGSSLIQGVLVGTTATIKLLAVMGKPIASCTESYYAGGIVYNRYYVLDAQNLVWVYDSQNESLFSASANISWSLPDFQTNWCGTASGIAVISGWLVGTANNGIFAKPVVVLGNSTSTATTWSVFFNTNRWQGSQQSTSTIHYCLVGHQGHLYITDGAYLTDIFPDATLADPASTADNVQTLSSWIATSQFEGNGTVISGVSPTTSDNKRLPVVLFTAPGGTLPTAITAGTVYYITSGSDNISFQVFAASTSGSALDIQTGALGTQYFNSFYPTASASTYNGTDPTYVYTPQRLTMPNFEVSQCIAEIGNLIVIGCLGNTLYPWNQIDNLPSSIISLPEANVPTIITVNQMAYILAGNKGNIYITDGSVTSLVTTVPDYCAGIPGIPTSYIEPIFQWGTAMYLRGRVYFSLLDQTSAKVGNCGGIWSFVPTQNFYVGQDVGIGLRLENQNSYGSYNGYASVLLPKVNQNAIAPQYFSGWESSITSPTYGIDTTGTIPSAVTIIESDSIPTGTMLDKKTFSQIEFKLASPLLTGDMVTLFYRKNLTGTWVSCGAVKLQSDRLSGYVSVNFEKSQWLQLRTLLNYGSSFIRLAEERIR